MSNICPQKPKLNRQVWEHLEEVEARVYANSFEEIWVVTGPIYGEPNEHFQCGVDVPVAFFKVIVDEENGHPRALAFIIPQNVVGSERLAEFLTSVDTIEAKTGLDLLADLPDAQEESLEETTAANLW